MAGQEADPELAELIRRAIASERADIQVSMPGIVVSYDADSETATIQPATRRARYNAEDEIVAEEINPIQNVPVIWPSCAAFSISGVLAPGDGVDLVFSTYSHSGYRNTGSVATPQDLRPQSLSYPKAYPGFKAKKDTGKDTDNSIGVPTSGGPNPSRLHFTGAGVEVGATALDPVVTASKLKAILDSAWASGSAAGGPGAANFAAVTTAWTSAFPPGPVGDALWAAAAAASNLKAEQ